MLNMLFAAENESTNFVDVVIPSWGWPMLLAVIAGALLVDLLVFHRKAHVIGIREAAIESAIWIGLGLAFTGVIFAMFNSQGAGSASAIEYLSGYLIEESLSVDNVFIWALIFAQFKVPREFQHRTLFWGIFGAFVLRFVFIIVGVAVITRFQFLLLVFGIFLIYTGIKIFVSDEKETDPSEMRTMKVFRKFVPSVDHYDGQKMFTRDENGKRLATPLLAVLVLIEVSDVIFAVDSVPAVLAVSREPFIVFASNAFAILGLRALYFLLSDMRERFIYMPHTISVLLIYVGVKITASIKYHIPVPISLGIIVGVLTVGIVSSIIHDRRKRA